MAGCSPGPRVSEIPKAHLLTSSRRPLHMKASQTLTKPDAGFIWSIADMLRGPYRHKEFGTVILPFTVLARFDAALSDMG